MKLAQRSRGSITDYDEAKRWHEDACRSWKTLSRCWYWLAGPGFDDSRPQATQARANAEQDRILNGWEVDTLQEARDWNIRNPIPRFPYRRPPKTVAKTSKVRDFEADNTQDMTAALRDWTPTTFVARDWIQTFSSQQARVDLLLKAAQSAQDERTQNFYRGAAHSAQRGAGAAEAAAGTPVTIELLDIPNPDDTNDQPW